MNILKSNRGVTLLDLTIYMIAILLIVGILTSIRQFFFNNMDIVKENARYAEEFDNFNAFFLHDVKDSNDINISADGNTLIFSNGSVYVYKKYGEPGNNENDLGDIYRNSVKIASNVKSFTCTKETNYINNVLKNSVVVHITIGVTSSNVFVQNIRYILRYW